MLAVQVQSFLPVVRSAKTCNIRTLALSKQLSRNLQFRNNLILVYSYGTDFLSVLFASTGKNYCGQINNGVSVLIVCLIFTYDSVSVITYFFKFLFCIKSYCNISGIGLGINLFIHHGTNLSRLVLNMYLSSSDHLN